MSDKIEPGYSLGRASRWGVLLRGEVIYSARGQPRPHLGDGLDQVQLSGGIVKGITHVPGGAEKTDRTGAKSLP